jgi:hypothetical protein
VRPTRFGPHPSPIDGRTRSYYLDPKQSLPKPGGVGVDEEEAGASARPARVQLDAGALLKEAEDHARIDEVGAHGVGRAWRCRDRWSWLAPHPTPHTSPPWPATLRPRHGGIAASPRCRGHVGRHPGTCRGHVGITRG